MLDEKARDDEVGDTSGHSRGHEDKVDDEKSESQNYRYEGIAEQEGYGEKYGGKGDTIGVAYRNVSQKVYEAVGFGLEARSNTRVHQRDKRKVEAESKRYREIIDEGFGGKDFYAAFAAEKRGLIHTAALFARDKERGHEEYEQLRDKELESRIVRLRDARSAADERPADKRCRYADEEGIQQSLGIPQSANFVAQKIFHSYRCLF